jgi:hypothetical protein
VREALIKRVKKVLFILLCITAIVYYCPVIAEAATDVDPGWSDAEDVNSVDDSKYLGITKSAFATDGNILYAAWSQVNGDHTVIKVKKKDGTAWSDITSAKGLNLNGKNAADPFLVMYQGSLYCAWREAYFVSGSDSRYGIYIMKYDGGTSWSRVDGGGSTGICLSDDGADVKSIYLLAFGDKLYAAWDEKKLNEAPYTLHVKQYSKDTGTWTFIDGGTNSGINQNSGHSVINPYLISYEGLLYAAWEENDGNRNQIIIKKCDVNNSKGTYIWQAANGDTDAAITNDTSSSSNGAKLFILNNTLYAVWTKNTSICAASYNQNENKWVTLNSLTGTGVMAGRIDITVYNNRAYVIYFKGTKTCVLKYDGVNVTNLITSSSAYLSSTIINDRNKMPLPAIAVVKHKLYASWLEQDATALYHIKYRSISLPYLETTANLTEDNLDGATISLALNGASFKSTTYKAADFTLSNAPEGLTIKNVTDNSGVCVVKLAYNGKDFDSDIKLGITVAAAAISTGEEMTDTVTITANKDTESIAISDNGITEGEENGKIITVKLAGGKFVDTINPEHWSVTNLPDGVKIGTVTKVDENTVNITLSGNSTKAFTTDIKNVTVACTAQEYTDSTGGGTLTAASGVTIKAAFGNLVIATSGSGTITLNGNPITVPYSSPLARGNFVTLTATAGTNYYFMYWLNTATGSIVSGSDSYSFYTGTTTGVTAVFKPNPTTSFQVVFQDPLGNILGTQTIESGKDATAPSAPYLIGYEFIGWDKSWKKIAADTVITAQFKRLSATYTLTVDGGKITAGSGKDGGYQYDTQVTVTADVASSGQHFAYWTLNDHIVSREANFSFYTIMAAMNLKAIYEEGPAPTSKEPFISIFPAVTAGTDGKSLLFIANRDTLPDGYTLIESGILLYRGGTIPSGNLTIDTEGVVVAKVENTSTNQFFIRKNGVSSGDTWYARAYMMYFNTTTGKIAVIYSNDTVNKAL